MAETKDTPIPRRWDPRGMEDFWARCQRKACERDAPHYRFLVDPRRGGNETPRVDLGPCKHWPDAVA